MTNWLIKNWSKATVFLAVYMLAGAGMGMHHRDSGAGIVNDLGI